MATAEVCLEHGILMLTFSAWKAKFGGVVGWQATAALGGPQPARADCSPAPAGKVLNPFAPASPRSGDPWRRIDRSGECASRRLLRGAESRVRDRQQIGKRRPSVPARRGVVAAETRRQAAAAVRRASSRRRSSRSSSRAIRSKAISRSMIRVSAGREIGSNSARLPTVCIVSVI